MYGALLILHIIVCLGLVLVVLLQAGRGGGLVSGAFSGTAQSMFGSKGAVDFLTKATVALGGVFFLTSLTLALISSNTRVVPRSVIQEQARRAGAAAPAQQAPPQQAPPSQAAPGAGQAPAPSSPPPAQTAPPPGGK
jgi:preprotein translocase subunit SecG